MADPNNCAIMAHCHDALFAQPYAFLGLVAIVGLVVAPHVLVGATAGATMSISEMLRSPGGTVCVAGTLAVILSTYLPCLVGPARLGVLATASILCIGIAMVNPDPTREGTDSMASVHRAIASTLFTGMLVLMGFINGYEIPERQWYGMWAGFGVLCGLFVFMAGTIKVAGEWTFETSVLERAYAFTYMLMLIMVEPRPCVI